MSKSKQWEDWLDERRIQEKGEYVLHRNYIENGQFLHSTYSDIETRSGNRIGFIGNTKPIAIGITAFLAGDNRSSEYVKYYLQKGKPFSSLNTYLLYFKGCKDEFLKMRRSLPFQDKEQDTEQDFLSVHLHLEKKNYLKSLRYFKENKDEYDKRLNERLDEYVKGYFLWLESLRYKIITAEEKDDLAKKTSVDNHSTTILKESVVLRLWEEFGSSFPYETKESWQSRWINDSQNLIPIQIDKFKQGNNKHLLLPILNLCRPKMKVPNMNDYVKKRWGLTSYTSDIAKYISHSEQPYPEVREIEQILKSA